MVASPMRQAARKTLEYCREAIMNCRRGVDGEKGNDLPHEKRQGDKIKKWNRPDLLSIIVLTTKNTEKKGRSVYIITYTCTLENQKNYLVQIEPPEEIDGFFR